MYNALAIVTANLEINSIDVSETVTALTFIGERDAITVPPTMTEREGVKAGSDRYFVRIDWLQSQAATPTSIEDILWTALGTADGTITVSGTLRSGDVSESNPQWSGTAVVVGVELGGEKNTIGTGSQTFQLTDRPTVTTSA